MYTEESPLLSLRVGCEDPGGVGPYLSLKMSGTPATKQGEKIQEEEILGAKAKRGEMRASLGTRIRLLCRSTEYGVFGDVNFVLWAWGAVHSFTWGKMWFAFSFEIFL